MQKSYRKSSKMAPQNSEATKKDEVPLNEQIVANMKGELRAEYRKVKAAMASASANTLHSRYKVGLIVLRVKNKPNKYGKSAVIQLEAALGIDAKSLYRLASVAEIFPKESFLNKILARKNPHGLPLTWSHLVEVSNIEDPKKRERAIDKALSMGMSARQLKGWIKGAHRAGDSKALKQDVPSGGIESKIRDLTVRAEEAAWDQETWQATLSQLTDSPLPSTVVDSLKRAQAMHLRLKESCTLVFDLIGAVLARTQIAPQAQGNPTMAAAVA